MYSTLNELKDAFYSSKKEINKIPSEFNWWIKDVDNHGGFQYLDAYYIEKTINKDVYHLILERSEYETTLSECERLLIDWLIHEHIEFKDGIDLSIYVEPLFLCRWNGIHSINGRSSHEIVEIHSKNTLRNKYQETNLFDNDLNPQLDLNRWIDLTSQDNDFYNRPFINDNFEIERIK